MAEGALEETQNEEEAAEARGKSSSLSVAIFRWVMIVVMVVVVLAGVRSYSKTLKKKRALIMQTIENRGLTFDNPEIKEKYQVMFRMYWLPNLNRLLEEANSIPINLDRFPSNPEAGSYISYIQRHKIKFNERDALEWQSNNIRRSSRWRQ